MSFFIYKITNKANSEIYIRLHCQVRRISMEAAPHDLQKGNDIYLLHPLQSYERVWGRGILNLTRAEYARLFGVSKTTIGNIQRGNPRFYEYDPYAYITKQHLPTAL